MFPTNFLWGVSLSGFQFEMGSPESVDANTDWYVWVHDPSNIERGVVSGDLPENGVNYWFLYRKDHELAQKLGMNMFRIGIEWSRIFSQPTRVVSVGVERDDYGLISRVDIDEGDLEKLDGLANKESLEHYRSIISDLREKGFLVIVCLNHFTLPLWIHDPFTAKKNRLKRGPCGWVDDTIVVEFAKYAAYIAWKLGDLVDWWATLNEPMVVAERGYLLRHGDFPPGVYSISAYRKACINMALAHARAYDVIKRWDTVRADSDSPAAAFVGLIHNVIPFEPLNPERGRDVEAAAFLNYAHNEWMLNALTKGWLDINLNRVEEGKEEKQHLANRLDWIGVNYYTRYVVKGRFPVPFLAPFHAFPALVDGYGFACKPGSKSLAGRPVSDFGWEVYPEGLAKALDVVSKYRLPLLVTENGIADSADRLRPRFIVDHLEVMEKYLESGRARVLGYLHWSLLDNYEWAQGFKMKFGLCEVDLRSKVRKPRRSAYVYSKIIEEGSVTEEVKNAAGGSGS